MARPKSEFLKAAGTMWEIWQTLVNEVLSLGGNDNSLRRVLTDTKLLRKIALLFVNDVQEVWKSLTSVGKTGEEWIFRLDGKRLSVGNDAKKLLRSVLFTTTTGKVYHLVIVKGDEFTDAERTNEKIRIWADRRGYLTPPVEVALLLRESTLDKEIERMGLYTLVVMHEPITNRLLGVGRSGTGSWLDALGGRTQDQWSRDYGFVFLVPSLQ